MGEVGRWGGGGGGGGGGVTGLVLGTTLLLVLLQCCSANTDTNARLSLGFGKPRPQQPQQQPKQPLGPPCNKQSDCDPFLNTTCLKDPRDNRNRCLCGDRTQPNNAQCQNTYRIIRFPCMVDSECIENAECVIAANLSTNATQGVPELSSLSIQPSHFKICWCKEGLKPNEELDECGDGSIVLIPSAALIFISIFFSTLKL